MIEITKTKAKKSYLDSVRARVVGADSLVPVLSGKQCRYIFFDNAASTPVLQPVLDELNRFMPWYSSVHRGSGIKSQLATQAYDDAREVVGKFFGGSKRDHVVIFGKNTTEAINKLSYRLELDKDDVVLISNMEHHSNDLPWRKVAEVHRIGTSPTGDLMESELDDLLDKFKGKVKLVAISGGSNVTGHMPDIHAIAAKVHRSGAQILVDCAQLAPHRKVDMKALDELEHLDYVVASAHKLYAPFGTGVLVGRRDTFETGVPELCGGGTIEVVTTTQVEWAAPPDREEAGSPNVVGAITMAKALRELESIGMDNIADHETELTAYALSQMKAISGVTILGNSNPRQASQRLGVIPFKINGLASGLVAAILSTEWGIGVRSGCFCAHPYVTNLLKVSAPAIEKFRTEVVAGDRSHMPGVVRVSFGMYNTKQEVDVLVAALEDIAVGKYEGKYRQEKSSGDYSALGWEPDLSKLYKL